MATPMSQETALLLLDVAQDQPNPTPELTVVIQRALWETGDRGCLRVRGDLPCD